MTEKISFGKKWGQILVSVERQKQIADVDLMLILGFTPPSWKIWKPKLIEYSMLDHIITSKFSEEDKTPYKIVYDKSTKSWLWEKE